MTTIVEPSPGLDIAPEEPALVRLVARAVGWWSGLPDPAWRRPKNLFWYDILVYFRNDKIKTFPKISVGSKLCVKLYREFLVDGDVSSSFAGFPSLNTSYNMVTVSCTIRCSRRPMKGPGLHGGGCTEKQSIFRLWYCAVISANDAGTITASCANKLY